MLEEGMSIGEIASRLDRTETAIKSRIRKLRKRHPERFKSTTKHVKEQPP